MAADYATGISSSPQDLLQTVVSWLVTQGWTLDSSISQGTGWRAHLHKDGLYVNLRAAMDERIWWMEEGPPIDYHDEGDGGYGIGIYLGDGYDGGDEWYEQSGAPVRTSDGTTIGVGANLPSGSVAAYHLFDDGADNIVVVIERQPGIFCHFGWGPALADAGQPEDFPYFFGSSPAYRNTSQPTGSLERFGINVTARAPMSPADQDYKSTGGSPSYMHTTAMIRVDAATFAAQWVGNNDGEDGGFGYTGRVFRPALNTNPLTQTGYDVGDFPNYKLLQTRAHQTAFAGGILLPLHCYVLTDPDGRWAPIGYPESVFFCDVYGHGYGAGEIYQVGGLDYMVFPGFAVRKGA